MGDIGRSCEGQRFWIWICPEKVFTTSLRTSSQLNKSGFLSYVQVFGCHLHHLYNVYFNDSSSNILFTLEFMKWAYSTHKSNARDSSCEKISTIGSHVKNDANRLWAEIQRKYSRSNPPSPPPSAIPARPGSTVLRLVMVFAKVNVFYAVIPWFKMSLIPSIWSCVLCSKGCIV